MIHVETGHMLACVLKSMYPYMLMTNYYRSNVIKKKNLLDISKLPKHTGLVYPSQVLWLCKCKNVYLFLPPVLKKQ